MRLVKLTRFFVANSLICFAAKGIFDEKYKKQLPFLPNKIGIITSPTGSVIHDILNRLKERFPVNVDLWPTPVQGNEAAEMIINAIKGFNDNHYSEQPSIYRR